MPHNINTLYMLISDWKWQIVESSWKFEINFKLKNRLFGVLLTNEAGPVVDWIYVKNIFHGLFAASKPQTVVLKIIPSIAY